MTTTNEAVAYETDFQAKIDATVQEGELRFKAYGTDAQGHAHFVTFGTPGSYSRDNVRRIAERLFDKHAAKPHLVAIRRADKNQKTWVQRNRIGGKAPVSEGLCR